MTKFNVLPGEYRVKDITKKLKPLTILFPVVAVSLFFAFAMTVGIGVLKCRDLNNRLETMVQERDLLKDQGERLIIELGRLREKESVLIATTNLLKGDVPLLELFRQIELSLPGGVWLSSLSAELDKAQINGFSYNENDVVLFATGLIQSSVVGQVGFPNTRRVTVDGQSLVEFRLSCSLVMP